MDKGFTGCLPSVPVASSPFVVVDGPALDHGTAAVEGSLIGLVRLVALEALPSHLNGLFFFRHVAQIVGGINKTFEQPDACQSFQCTGHIGKWSSAHVPWRAWPACRSVINGVNDPKSRGFRQSL